MDILFLSPEGKKLLIDIKFIASCPENKKISLQQKKYIPPNGWTLENIKRQVMWETREDLITFIDRILSETTAYLQKEKNSDVIQLFIKFLEEMEVGVENLKETYRNEPDVLSSLSVYIEQLKILIRNVSSSSSLEPPQERKSKYNFCSE